MDCTEDSEFTEYMENSELMDYSDSMDEYQILMQIICQRMTISKLTEDYERVMNDNQYDEIDENDDTTNEYMEYNMTMDEHFPLLKVREPKTTCESCSECVVNNNQYDRMDEDGDDKNTEDNDNTDDDDNFEDDI